MVNKCVLLCAFLAAAVPLNAQFSGRVSGTVMDATGAVIPDAQVDLYLAGGSRPLLSAHTTAEGLYSFIGVRPAEYDLSVEVPGFVRATVRRIVVDPGRETSVPQVRLQLSTVTQ